MREITRRSCIKIIGIGATAGLAGCLSGGYDEPDEAVEAFVEHVNEGEYDQASEILAEHDDPRDMLERRDVGDLINGRITNLRTNVLSEDSERAEVEILYNDEDHFDPAYDFGTLFFLRNNGGWLIVDYDPSHIGQGL